MHRSASRTKKEPRLMSTKTFQRQYDLLASAMLSRFLLLATVMALPACHGESGRTGFAASRTNTAAPILTPAVRNESLIASLIRYVLNSVLVPAPRTTSLPGNSIGMPNTGTSTPATTENTIAFSSGALTILHIEDNPDDLRAMREMFTSLHTLTLRTTRTGEFGIKLATANPPALILLDMALPGINGAEVLRRLREDPATRDIPVVAITSHSAALGMELGLTGFDDYLVKPIDPASLESVLNRRLSALNKKSPEPAVLVKQ